jgi:hypothetical protein
VTIAIISAVTAIATAAITTYGTVLSTKTGLRDARDELAEAREGLATSSTAHFLIRGGEEVRAPLGTRDDWEILVVPESFGQAEPNSEHDNAVQAGEFRAVSHPGDSQRWRIVCRSKFNSWLGKKDGDGKNIPWTSNRCHVLLVAKRPWAFGTPTAQETH